jgi:hypothetical protein
MEKKEIDIGKLIQGKLKEQDRSKAWLAKKVSYDASSFCKLLNRNHIDTELLLLISKALDYDFFRHYSSFIIDTKQNTKTMEELPTKQG